MRIGIIAPLAYPIPPLKYGGTEQVVYYLVEGLVKNGHDVTLFCDKGSKVTAKIDDAWGNPPNQSDLETRIYYDLNRMNYIANLSGNFDIIHNHNGFLPISQSQFFKCPIVTTFHSTLKGMVNDDAVRKSLLEKTNAITISNSQRKDFPDIDYTATVYNGTVDMDKYTFGNGGNYLAWIGRFNTSKGSATAVESSLITGHALKMAAEISSDVQQEYFDKNIKPYLDSEKIQYLGGVGLEEKVALLKDAKAFLMPIEWEEPFGLVVIEANACGTPVIAYNRGSMSELIVNGKNGFLVPPNDVESFKAIIERIYSMPEADYQKLRESCRQHVQENFTIEMMVSGYEMAYKKVLDKNG